MKANTSRAYPVLADKVTTTIVYIYEVDALSSKPCVSV